MIYVLPIFMTILLMTGCSAPNKQIKPETKTLYPSWYIDPVKNSEIYLYGRGSGENSDTALKNALLDISSKLSLRISSTSNISKESYRDYREYTQKSVKEDIYTKTEDLTFTDYEIFKSKRLRYNLFALMVRVKKENLANSIKNEIEPLYKKLEMKNGALEKKDPLSRYLEYTKLLEELSTKRGKVDILKILDPKFDGRFYYKTLNTIAKAINAEKEKASFFIDNTSGIVQLSNILKEDITNRGFNFTDPDKAKYILRISMDQNRNMTHGIYLVQSTITVEIYNGTTLLKSTNFKVKGASSNGFDDAQSDSIKDFEFEDIF